MIRKFNQVGYTQDDGIFDGFYIIYREPVGAYPYQNLRNTRSDYLQK